MLHRIPVERLRAEVGPGIDSMAEAVSRCVHCGFCLATCPTYLTLGQEMDSPRGRIFLMKEVLEGGLDLEDTLVHIDPCLGCLACETSCPSGVEYGHLLHPFRALAETRRRGALRRARRHIAIAVLSSPVAFRWMARLGGLVRPLRALAPAGMRSALELLPARLARRTTWPEVTSAQGPRRARVGLLTGCAQQVLAPDIQSATIEVLQRNGVEVVVPRGQGCCGALALHAGHQRQAQRLAARNLTAFPDDLDAVLTHAAGCGSALQETGRLFAGADHEAAACRLSERVVDASAFLDRIGLTAPLPPLAQPLRVVYQDACHLAHAQGVRAAPRRLLQAIPGVELVEVAEPEVCCGSAGSYNLEHPQIAGELGERKARNLATTGARIVASGNIGCITQVAHHLRALDEPIAVRHTFQVLRDAYREELASGPPQ